MVEAKELATFLSGRKEKAVVQALAQQRERSRQSGGREALCITLDKLATQLGLPQETPADRRRAKENLMKAIWRVNSKLAARELTIASLHTSLGVPGWALFRLSEVWSC